MNTFNNKVVSKIHGEKKTMLFILLVCFILSCNSKLLMVYQVGRHGYRSPKSKFEGLIEDESQNFNKFKELLTNYGLQQTFERGENIMKRYKSILKDVDIKNVKVKSSFIARTRFSALSQLLGMFGSVNCKNEMILFTSANHTLELEDLEDIPQKLRECLSEFLPYVDVDEKATSIFNMGFMNCTLYSTMLGEYTPEELLTLSDLKHKIIDWTNENYPIKISELNHFCGTIRSNYEHGLKLNSKISQNDSYIVDICKSFSYERKRHETAVNEIVSLLNCNEQLKFILNVVELAAKQFESSTAITPVYYFDSCHESNILSIMSHLGNNEKFTLKFGSSLFFELHEDDTTHKLFMKIFLDEAQLSLHQNALYLNFGKEDQIINLPKSTFIPLAPADETNDKSCSLNYFRKLIKSRTFEESTDDLCNKDANEIITLNKHKIQIQNSSVVFLLKRNMKFNKHDQSISY